MDHGQHRIFNSLGEAQWKQASALRLTVFGACRSLKAIEVSGTALAADNALKNAGKAGG